MRTVLVYTFRLIYSAFCLALLGCASTPIDKSVSIERISAEQLAILMQTAPASKSLQEIANMLKAGVTDEQMIADIKATQSRYALSPSEVIHWHQQGISKAVLDYLQQANQLAVQNLIADKINQQAIAHAQQEKALKRQRDYARQQALYPYGGLYSQAWIGRPDLWGWYPYNMRRRYGLGLGWGW